MAGVDGFTQPTQAGLKFRTAEQIVPAIGHKLYFHKWESGAGRSEYWRMWKRRQQPGRSGKCVQVQEVIEAFR